MIGDDEPAGGPTSDRQLLRECADLLTDQLAGPVSGAHSTRMRELLQQLQKQIAGPVVLDCRAIAFLSISVDELEAANSRPGMVMEFPNKPGETWPPTLPPSPKLTWQEFGEDYNNRVVETAVVSVRGDLVRYRIVRPRWRPGSRILPHCSVTATREVNTGSGSRGDTSVIADTPMDPVLARELCQHDYAVRLYLDATGV